MKELIISIGSNYDQKANMAMAQHHLGSAFSEISFSRMLWTKPIGMNSDKFLNCLCFTHTALSEEKIMALLKTIERDCGNTAELRKDGIILIDIDLLLYGEKQLHQGDWRRDYIKMLLDEHRTEKLGEL